MRTDAIGITGIGITSAAGAGVAALQRALDAGDVRVRELAPAIVADLPMKHGGAFDPAVVAPDERLRRAHLACAPALDEALDQAKCPRDRSWGLSIGSALPGIEALELAVENGGDMPAGPHELTEGLAERHGLSAVASSFSATCASSLYALEAAIADVRRERASVVVCGGVDTLSRFMQSGFCALGALAGFQDGDSLVLGEAACFLVVEPIATARARGVRPVGQIRGQAFCADASHLTAPDESGRGMIDAVRACLDDADCSIADVTHVSLTAGASPKYTEMYDNVRAELFADSAAEFLTWEHSVGHVLAASGVFGVAHATMQLARGPGCVLALTVGFGGQNGATLIDTVPEDV